MSKTEKNIWYVLFSVILIPLFINFFHDFLKVYVLWIIPSVIAVLVIGYFVSIISSILELRNSNSLLPYVKILIFAVLIISSIALICFLRNNPQINTNLVVCILPNLREDTTVNNDEKENPDSWFIDDCFPETWNVFNLENSIEDGCLSFNDYYIESHEVGFNIQNLENNVSRFLIFRPVDRSISRISFSIYIKKITTPMSSLPNVFYFGFISKDPKLIYGSTTQTPPNDAFDGEYILFTSSGDENTLGTIRQGKNPHELFNGDQTYVTFRNQHRYNVEIELIGNYWNVKINDMTELRPEFTRTNLNTKGYIFAFGFKIPQNGITNLEISDLQVE